MGSEKKAMDYVASVAAEMGFSEGQINDIKTAVSEACLNAIEHASKLDASIKIGIRLAPDVSSLHVEVQDQGGPIGKVKIPNIEKKIAGEEETRGWGIFLIKSLVDEVSFKAVPNVGNIVKMVIHLDK